MRPIVIGVDARELVGDRTGVGRYLGELMRRWTSREDLRQRHFVLYTPEPLEMAFPAHAADVRVLAGGRGTWWEQTTLSAAIRRDDPDVFFAPAYTAPFSLRVPLAVTIHDVSFSRHPEWFRPREGMRRRWLTRQGARRAGVVLTVSEFSKREIVELYHVPPERIRVIPNGVRHPRCGAPQREPLVLYVGSIFNRRNVPDLIAAFAQALSRVPEARLAIVGDNRSWPRQDLASLIRRSGLEDRIAVKDYVTDDELDRLYGSASVFAFLSEYEGFGLTPLEALAVGTPIVVLDTPVSREVYGDAAQIVPPHDIAAISDAIVRLLTSAEARAAKLAHADAVVRRYSWDDAADATLAAIEGIARR